MNQTLYPKLITQTKPNLPHKVKWGFKWPILTLCRFHSELGRYTLPILFLFFLKCAICPHYKLHVLQICFRMLRRKIIVWESHVDRFWPKNVFLTEKNALLSPQGFHCPWRYTFHPKHTIVPKIRWDPLLSKMWNDGFLRNIFLFNQVWNDEILRKTVAMESTPGEGIPLS